MIFMIRIWKLRFYWQTFTEYASSIQQIHDSKYSVGFFVSLRCTTKAVSLWVHHFPHDPPSFLAPCLPSAGLYGTSELGVFLKTYASPSHFYFLHKNNYMSHFFIRCSFYGNIAITTKLFEKFIQNLKFKSP